MRPPVRIAAKGRETAQNFGGDVKFGPVFLRNNPEVRVYGIREGCAAPEMEASDGKPPRTGRTSEPGAARLRRTP